MAFTIITPILKILDEAKAKEFYVDFLGFKVDWEHRAEGPLYMQISLGECRIHLSEHDGDARQGAAIKLHTDDIEAYVCGGDRRQRIPARGSQNRTWASANSLGVVWICCLLIRSAIGSSLRMLESGRRGCSDIVSVVGNHPFFCVKS